MPIRIALINTVACNGGDAAILAAIAAQLRDTFPRCVITAYDSQPAAAARHHDWIRFDGSAYHAAAASGISAWARRVRWLVAAALRGAGRPRAAARIVHRADVRRLSRIARADLAVSTGGTYLVDTYSLKPRFFEFLAVRLLRLPLVLHTQTIGPFHSRFNRAGMRRVLRWAGRVFVRDRASRDIAIGLGARADTTFIAPDVVFGAAPASSVDELRAATIGARPSICISVRELKPFAQRAEVRDAYEAAVAELVVHLVRHRAARVDFLSTCQGIPEYRYDDARVAARIAALLPAEVAGSFRVIEGRHSPDELIARYATYDAVIATRMHAAILALDAGTPVLPIPYERKIDELFRELDAPFTIVDATQASGAALIASWREFEQTLPHWRESAAARLAEWRTAARLPVAEIRRLLAERRASAGPA